MNQANNKIDTPSLPVTRLRSSELRPARSGFVVHQDQDGVQHKISKSGRIDPHLVCLLQPTAFLAESYFRLRHAVEEMRRPECGIVLGVTSPQAGDGKTLTAINLAGALAQNADARVLLVDLNFRKSAASVHQHFDLQPDASSGVAGWVAKVQSGNELTTYQLPDFNLSLIPSGSCPESPYELLKSPRLDELFEQARQQFDYIIVDTPQTLLLPDIELIERVVDGFLIVVKANSTTREKLEEMLNLMAQEKVLGLIFNGAPTRP